MAIRSDDVKTIGELMFVAVAVADAAPHRRSRLSVPANVERLASSARRPTADQVVPDLEDSVPALRCQPGLTLLLASCRRVAALTRTLDGGMVDAPLVSYAERILAASAHASHAQAATEDGSPC
jgi:citrate lyase beta subunit